MVAGRFERNILAMGLGKKGLADALASAGRSSAVSFPASETGEPVPAYADGAGRVRPLHSLRDPEREAERLAAQYAKGGFFLLLGLGGGYLARALLARQDCRGLMIVERGLGELKALFEEIDYAEVLADGRTQLAVDLGPGEIAAAITEAYLPSLAGDFAMAALRQRVELDQDYFSRAGEAARRALERVGQDFSVQAHFGKRWFSNIVRNLLCEGEGAPSLPPCRRAIVAAAGPSLEAQLPAIERARKDAFLIASDTSLPFFLAEGVEPDAVVSIDCQQISYHHFMAGYPRAVPLVLDLASPPLLASFSDRVHFASSGHPLCRYLSSRWRPLPFIDTSGGNVTHAAVSLADSLGAREVLLFGADFSYPRGACYARGTYLHRHFESRQDRFHGVEHAFQAFLFRDPGLERESDERGWRYVTRPLAAYRERLEALSASMSAELVCARGEGAYIRAARGTGLRGEPRLFGAGRKTCPAREFLAGYRGDLAALDLGRGFTVRDATREERELLYTILPSAAGLSRWSEERGPALLEAARRSCVAALDSALS